MQPSGGEPSLRKTKYNITSSQERATIKNTVTIKNTGIASYIIICIRRLGSRLWYSNACSVLATYIIICQHWHGPQLAYAADYRPVRIIDLLPTDYRPPLGLDNRARNVGTEHALFGPRAHAIEAPGSGVVLLKSLTSKLCSRRQLTPGGRYL